MPITSVSKRGRPARYHDATCRQRAHRARWATQHEATFDTLTKVEAAITELHHALIANRDTAAVYGRIVQATAKLAQQLDHDVPVLENERASHATKSVTTTVAPSDVAPLSTTGFSTASNSDRAVTDRPEPNNDAPPAHVTKTIDMQRSIGPGWTLVQFTGDADASIWRLHHDGQSVGTVRRDYDLATNTRGWEARTVHYLQVPAPGSLAVSSRNDRLWRTRDSAAAGIARQASRSTTYKTKPI
jgi:hypothetical protein